MKTIINKTLAITAIVAAGLFSSLSATAGLLTTPTQTQTFNFATLSDPAVDLAFNGFNSALGTLNSVHLTWSISTLLNNTVFNSKGTPVAVGNPVPLTATATTTFTGSIASALLTGTNTLTTPGFVGNVAPGFSTVGTASSSNVPGLSCLSNDASCGAGNSNLSAYIGGLNLFTINVASSGTQGGSVPGGVFTGNDGNANGSVSLFYDYSSAAIPAPGTFALLGLGLLGLTGMRRKTTML